ncbi:DUF222 domain-containing protein [Pseudarthrobacter sp. S9]|uniref:HNH endonuclease signature motif containing protein n=1 Tax=Pseudarthrobacter sp. S9 TaxID=3418421 RepID=UPI003CFEBA31
MEATREFSPFQDTGQAAAQAPQRGVAGALALLQSVNSTAVEDAALWTFRTAADFAGQVEELSRTVEFLQLVAAGAVDRTRNRAAVSAASGGKGWTTGWLDDSTGGPALSGGSVDAGAEGAGADDASTAMDDGYRNTTEFLRARLRISATEARRRLSLAESILPRHGIAGQPQPAVHEELGAALAAGELGSRAATIIALALDRVRHACDADAAARMEHALTRTAAENDPDFLVRVARRWTDALDQDGAEPSEELLRRLQGAFIRRTRHGLHHLEIFATTDQYEHLITVMNTAANPRSTGTAAPDVPATGQDPAAGTPAGVSTAGDVSAAVASPEDEPGAAGLDWRSRPQKLLDGLVGACKAALAAGSLPAAGGLRPQVMVTIDYRDLLARLGDSDGAAAGDTAAAGRTTEHTGTLLFTGPVTTSTVRTIACDANIIPVLLGGEGQILDIGRTSRIFPPHIRKALTARDQGCAFPGCTTHAPWCEAHHISYWSRGGTTGAGNGTLLCTHHHHLIHKEQWTIQMRSGIPWFIPPPHVDPRQVPRRNHYFRPLPSRQPPDHGAATRMQHHSRPDAWACGLNGQDPSHGY